jgi:hypothetical protein
VHAGLLAERKSSLKQEVVELELEVEAVSREIELERLGATRMAVHSEESALDERLGKGELVVVASCLTKMRSCRRDQDSSGENLEMTTEEVLSEPESGIFTIVDVEGTVGDSKIDRILRKLSLSGRAQSDASSRSSRLVGFVVRWKVLDAVSS